MYESPIKLKMKGFANCVYRITVKKLLLVELQSNCRIEQLNIIEPDIFVLWELISNNLAILNWTKPK